MEATITWAPWRTSSSTAWRTVSLFRCLVFRKVLTMWMCLPLPRSMSSSRVWRLARKLSKPPLAMPTTPTTATSPSIRALVAWVVEWATKTTSSGAMLFSRRQFSKLFTTPAATPRGSSWVVLTLDLPMISWVALSMATALVWVPPTSMPMRTVLAMSILLYWVCEPGL